MKLPGPVRSVREAWLRLRWDRAGMPWRLHGVPCRIPPTVRAQFHPAWEPHVSAWLRARVRPGQVLFDVGANVGAYVVQFAAWSAPDGRVVAFEPNPGAVVWLERVVRMNGLAERVTVVERALGAEAGSATLHATAADGMSRLGRRNPLLSDSVTLPVTVDTLDDWCARHGIRPDWVLVDVEGWEAQVLRGGAAVLADPEVGVVVEMHPAAWADAGSSREHLAEAIARLGRRPVSIGGDDPFGSGHAALVVA